MDDYEYEGEPTAEELPADEMVFEVRLSQYNMSGLARDLANQMADRVMREHRDDIKNMARELVAERVRTELDAAIKPIIEDALGQPLIPTDAFGKQKGEPTTARDIIAKGAEEYLNTTLDAHGKPTNDSFWREKRYTRISQMLGGVLDDKFDREMKAAIEKMKGDVRDQMKAAATAWLAEFQQRAQAAMAKPA